MTSICRVLLLCALLAAGPGAVAQEKVFLHWDVACCLGLLGGPTPQELETGKPPFRSPEEIAELDEAEKVACLRYEQIRPLHQQGLGASPAEFFAAGYALSRAQARLSWAQGHASAAVARLEQALQFAGDQPGVGWLGSAKAAYEAKTGSLLEFIAASEASAAAKESLTRVRVALKKLGYDLSDVPQQPQIDPRNPKKDECIK
jgi:hypothetical protein